jgi:hypothetical protein
MCAFLPSASVIFITRTLGFTLATWNCHAVPMYSASMHQMAQTQYRPRGSLESSAVAAAVAVLAAAAAAGQATLPGKHGSARLGVDAASVAASEPPAVAAGRAQAAAGRGRASSTWERGSRVAPEAHDSAAAADERRRRRGVHLEKPVQA